MLPLSAEISGNQSLLADNGDNFPAILDDGLQTIEGELESGHEGETSAWAPLNKDPLAQFVGHDYLSISANLLTFTSGVVWPAVVANQGGLLAVGGGLTGAHHNHHHDRLEGENTAHPSSHT